MDLGFVVSRSSEVLVRPTEEYWREVAKTPVSADFQEKFLFPFAGSCGVLVCLPYLRYGLVPALMMGILTAGFLAGLPYVMCWLGDSVATGMGGVGFGRATMHLWAMLQVPLGVGLVLGAITEPFNSTQVLAFAGLVYTIYLSTLFLPEVYRVPGEKRSGFLVAIGVGYLFAYILGRLFLDEVSKAMVLERLARSL